MESFDRLTAVAAPLALSNVDTDLLIPARYMKGLTRDALGRQLFHELRYAEDGAERDDFILNHPQCRTARILVGAANFGCGSSREHAVWALADFGIRCVIASSFGDIFAANARRNGLLLVTLPETQCALLRTALAESQYAPITVDLIEQQIALASGENLPFRIDPADRQALLEGLDDIARTLRHEDAIARFEARA